MPPSSWTSRLAARQASAFGLVALEQVADVDGDVDQPDAGGDECGGEPVDLRIVEPGELEGAIAERMHRPAGDLLVAMTAHITFAVLQIAAESSWAGRGHAGAAGAIEEMLRTLNTLDLVIPALPQTAAPTGKTSRRRA